MDSETNATPGLLYPGEPCSAQDWNRIRNGVFDRIVKTHGHIIMGDLCAVINAVEAEMKQAPNRFRESVALDAAQRKNHQAECLLSSASCIVEEARGILEKLKARMERQEALDVEAQLDKIEHDMDEQEGNFT